LSVIFISISILPGTISELPIPPSLDRNIPYPEYVFQNPPENISKRSAMVP
jgi:hypothetical protein